MENYCKNCPWYWEFQAGLLDTWMISIEASLWIFLGDVKIAPKTVVWINSIKNKSLQMFRQVVGTCLFLGREGHKFHEAVPGGGSASLGCVRSRRLRFRNGGILVRGCRPDEWDEQRRASRRERNQSEAIIHGFGRKHPLELFITLQWKTLVCVLWGSLERVELCPVIVFYGLRCSSIFGRFHI